MLTNTDRASIVKFIERNWHLKPLTHRSRDNLPNPITPHGGNPYVPAIDRRSVRHVQLPAGRL